LRAGDGGLDKVHELGYTHKKIEYVPSRRSIEHRRAFRELFKAQEDGRQFSAEQIVVVDETHSSDEDMRRKFGWALKGFPAFRRKNLRQGDPKMVSSIATMTINGPLTVKILVGETNTQQTFLHELEFNILPMMNQYPAPRSILLADNAPSHAKTNMKILCARFGVLLFFLPPYSFDFSPIELMFARTKLNMQVLGCNPDQPLPQHLRYHLWNSVTPQEACRMFQHCFIHVTNDIRARAINGEFAH